MRSTRVLFLGAFLLAGERVHFDASRLPQFTENQIRNTADATRAGMARWAATEHGQKLIEQINAGECQVNVIEDASENGIGRAPQPGIATLVAANNHARIKIYDVILNPTRLEIPDGTEPLPNQPVTPADMMTVAWAGEMLHIYFYSLGISLPHHARVDFQREWRAIAEELGMPMLRHDDEDERPRMRIRRMSR